MLNPKELCTVLDQVGAEIAVQTARISLVSACLSAFSRNPLESSHATTTLHGGGGSVLRTTGLTDRQWQALLQTVQEWLDGERLEQDDTAGLWTRLKHWRCSLASEGCATGGELSLPPRSDAPPVNSPGACCGPISDPENCAHTDTRIVSVLRDRLLMLAGLACGIADAWGTQMPTDALSAILSLARDARISAVQSTQ